MCVYIMNIINKLPEDIRDRVTSYVIGYKSIIENKDGSKYEIWMGLERYKTGIFREWYSNGYIKYEDNYIVGDRYGIQRKWYDNGMLSYEISYGYIPYDIVRYWYPNGELKYESILG